MWYFPPMWNLQWHVREIVMREILEYVHDNIVTQVSETDDFLRWLRTGRRLRRSAVYDLRFLRVVTATCVDVVVVQRSLVTGVVHSDSRALTSRSVARCVSNAPKKPTNWGQWRSVSGLGTCAQDAHSPKGLIRVDVKRNDTGRPSHDGPGPTAVFCRRFRGGTTVTALCRAGKSDCQRRRSGTNRFMIFDVIATILGGYGSCRRNVRT